MNDARNWLGALGWGACLALLMALAWHVYRPGLSGDFLFDDFGTLPSLGAYGPVDNATALGRYLTSGVDDPVGRPLTMATFLIDANDWPADPQAFKYTSVLLHLLNGALLVWALLRLGRATGLPESLARNAALLGSAFWLLHPLWVSTTLYVVQREAMLSATFVLIGLITWIAARGALARGETRRGILGMAAAAVGCTSLAVLCKANGALLPLMLLICDRVLLSHAEPMPTSPLVRIHERSVWILLKWPTLLLLAWMLSQAPSFARTATEIRDWTVWQRLLTEPRIMVDYLDLLWIPSANSSGLFNDGYVASSGLGHPWTTLPCVLVLAGMFVATVSLRRRYPAAAAVVLFFFAGHLLESTFVPLELYYEHRNYGPALLLFWPPAVWLMRAGKLATVRRIAAVSIVALLCVLTLSRASLWGNGYLQATVWAAQNPYSARAQANAADYDMAHGHPLAAVALLRRQISTHPGDLELPLALVSAQCQLGAVSTSALDASRAALVRTRIGSKLAFDWFNRVIELARVHACAGLDFAAVQSLLDTARSNSHWVSVAGRRQDFESLDGVLALAMKQPERALRAFNAALANDPDPTIALSQAARLGSTGYPQLGLAHLDYFASLPPSSESHTGMAYIHAWLLARQHYWEHETASLRSTLQADAAAKPETPSSRDNRP